MDKRNEEPAESGAAVIVAAVAGIAFALIKMAARKRATNNLQAEPAPSHQPHVQAGQIPEQRVRPAPIPASRAPRVATPVAPRIIGGLQGPKYPPYEPPRNVTDYSGRHPYGRW